MDVHNPVVAALAAATRTRGSEPLITWYEPATAARTELSVRSFANWVDKTANLLLDLDAAGQIVAGPISRERPGHWMALMLPVAAWQAGAHYRVDDLGGAAVTIIGPNRPAPQPAGTTLACSLHPLGLATPNLPPAVLDFSTEALGYPDAHTVWPVDDHDAAWTDADGTRTHAELDAAPQSGRVLVRPSSAWQSLADAVIGPLLGGGSAVVVDGEIDADALTRLAASERVTSSMA